MARVPVLVQVLAIAAGLLLALSGPGFAAKRTSGTKSGVTSQSRAGESGGSANTGSTIRPYDRRDDPYAPGVNWPGRW
ncbi:MAG TPA: hypothetical protein VFO74_07350 [Pseudolabrys sp.]|nr:hypothetical protein [Pseudolabrys sp.]